MNWTRNITDQGGAGNGLPRKLREGYQVQAPKGLAILRRLRRRWRLAYGGQLFYGGNMTSEQAKVWAKKVIEGVQ
jgi:hypothetical protein